MQSENSKVHILIEIKRLFKKIKKQKQFIVTNSKFNYGIQKKLIIKFLQEFKKLHHCLKKRKHYSKTLSRWVKRLAKSLLAVIVAAIIRGNSLSGFQPKNLETYQLKISDYSLGFTNVESLITTYSVTIRNLK